MAEDLSGLVEWAARRWRLIRRRSESVHHRLKVALPAEPVDARAQLGEEVGTLEELVAMLEPRLRQRGSEVLRREFGDATPEASHLAGCVFDGWDEAEGRVPKLREELPPKSRRFPLAAAKFVKVWNGSTWLHTPARGKLRIEDLHAGPFMSGHEFVDWNVEQWTWELEQQVRLSCTDILFVPVFFVAFVAAVLNGIGLSGWLAVTVAVVLLVPFMWWWVRMRRRGYISVGDD